MTSLWITFGLILSAVSVSALGAYFSIVGLGALFSGAMIAVFLMAGSLEFSKFVLAAYLHQTWSKLNKIFKFYVTFAVVTLSLITSIGIFGFLSEAYQSASTVLEEETIRLETIKKQNEALISELERVNYTIEEIPESRVTKRLEARKNAEPKILDLNKKISQGEKNLEQAQIKILEVKKKVGPLIYISKSLNINVDTVVRYLILIFVLVFDPLAICLVIASTQALDSRKLGAHVKNQLEEDKSFDVNDKNTENTIITDNKQNTENIINIEKEKNTQDNVIVQMTFKNQENPIQIDESETKNKVS